MFCVVLLDSPLKVSFKVLDEEFAELSNSVGIIPAPYAARHKWILVEDVTVFSMKEWDYYIKQSYSLVRSKLSRKKQNDLGAKTNWIWKKKCPMATGEIANDRQFYYKAKQFQSLNYE